MEMTVSLLISAIGLVVTGASFAYAIKTGQEKRRLELFIKEILAGLAKNVESIKGNPGWADSHFGKIRDLALSLDKNETVDKILWRAQEGSRDACAAERMLGNLHTTVQSVLKGLFPEDTKNKAEPSLPADPAQPGG